MSDDRVSTTYESPSLETSNLESRPSSWVQRSSLPLNSKVHSWIRKSSTTSPSLDLIKTGSVLFLALFVGTSVATSMKLNFFTPKVRSHPSNSEVIQRAGVGTRVEARRTLDRLNWEYLHRSRSISVQVPSTLPITGSTTSSYSTGSTSSVGSTTTLYSAVPTTAATTSTSVPVPIPAAASSPTTVAKVVPPKSPKEPKAIKVVPPKSPKEPKAIKVVPPKSPKEPKSPKD